MMKLTLAVAVLAVFAMASARPEKEYRTAFLKFIKDNGRHYAQSEFTAKYEAFKSNMDFVDTWNADPANHRVAINKFADLTSAQFNALYNGLKVEAPVNGTFVPAPAVTSIDWRTQGAVTPIKDQGQCGSCWAFSAIGSTEGAHFFASGTLVSLSEQNLVDCSTAQGNQGCNGGLMDQAFTYIISNHGVDTEASYPYKAVDGTCVFSAQNIGATLTGFTDVQSQSEADLVAKIQLGPVSVAIDASHSSFQLYKSGIYYERACSSTSLDHGVLAVGFDQTAAAKDNLYYIVKNSWGTSWGQEGYIWMSRNRNNNCGIATVASIPTAK